MILVSQIPLLFQPPLSTRPDAMILLRSIALRIALCSGVLMLTSCAPTAEISTLNPQSVNQSVTVTGTVVTIAPMLNQVVYEMEEKGQSIWVLTRQAPPKLGSTVTVSGKVRFESIAPDNVEIAHLYIEE